MAHLLEHSIVRILAVDGRPRGVGFLVTERHVVTSTHVVARSLGLSSVPPELPEAHVRLDFPLLTDQHILAASIVCWHSIASDGSGEVAGLELIDDPPTQSGPIRLVQADNVWAHRVHAFGFPEAIGIGLFSQSIDPFSAYETGLSLLRKHIGHDRDRLLQALNFEQRLRENILRSRQFGDNETSRSDRSQVINGLNELSLSLLRSYLKIQSR